MKDILVDALETLAGEDYCRLLTNFTLGRFYRTQTLAQHNPWPDHLFLAACYAEATGRHYVSERLIAELRRDSPNYDPLVSFGLNGHEKQLTVSPLTDKMRRFQIEHPRFSVAEHLGRYFQQ